MARPKGYRAVLHTKSAYYMAKSGGRWIAQTKSHFTESDIKSRFIDGYDYAKEQELKFYHSFFPNVNTYEAFIAELRKLFSQAKGDGERIESLSNKNLRQFMPKGTNQPQFTYQVIITGKLSEQIPIELIAPSNGSVKGGPIYLTLNLGSVNAIKSAINKELGRKKFNDISPNMRNLRRWFDEIVGDSITQSLTQNISITKTPNTNRNAVITGNLDGFLFAKNLDKKQRLAYLRGDYGPELQKQFQQEMQLALNSIKNFIFNTCLQVNNGTRYNGVNILQKAAEATWKEVIDSKPIEQQDFFFEGENLNKSVLGKGGEFQLSLKEKYIRLVLTQTDARLGHIIGDIIDGKRKEPRSDYQLVLELGGDIGKTILGIQVKNIGETSMQEIDINSDVGLIAPNLGVEFSDAIANSYFNTDIQSIVGNMSSYLTEYLNTYFWEGMNLNVGSNLDPTHTNTFYWNGGTALVPASTIIETLKNSPFKNPTFTIDPASREGMSDEDFQKGKEPPFLEYWYGNYKRWTPLFPNYKLYQQLLDDTKIHTSFSMARIFTANGGTAFFEFLNG